MKTIIEIIEEHGPVVGCVLVILFLAIMGVLVGGYGVLFMWAWNLIIPAIFHGPAITLLQSIALNILLAAAVRLIRAVCGKTNA